MNIFAKCVLATCAALLALSGCSGRHHAFGRLAYVAGSAQVFPRSVGPWTSAENGAPVFAGDSIKTGKSAEAVITFGNSTIKLGENTCVVISDSLDSQKKRLVAVLALSGEVVSDVKDVERRGAQYEVWTPTAVAHAEGTYYSVGFSAQPYATTVRVLDGKVRVFNPLLPSAPQVLVAPGCFTRVAYNAGPIAAAPMNYGQFRKMQPMLGPEYYHDCEIRFRIRPEEMALDAPIVVVPIGVPLFLPPPPMPMGPRGRLFFPAPFLPLPREAHGVMMAPVPLPPMPVEKRVVTHVRPEAVHEPHGPVMKVMHGAPENERGHHEDKGDRGGREKHAERKDDKHR